MTIPRVEVLMLLHDLHDPAAELVRSHECGVALPTSWDQECIAVLELDCSMKLLGMRSWFSMVLMRCFLS
jgi:hypothetical protein